MADGSVKKIEDIEMHDAMYGGGRVRMVIVGDGTGSDWYDVDGTHVTGSHLIQKQGEWMFVKDAGFAKIDGHDTYYTVVNENHRMVAPNGQVFGDFADYEYEGDSKWNEFLLATLNGENEFKPGPGGVRYIAHPAPARKMVA